MTTDPYQGRMHEPITLHNYMYANMNPVMYLDPSGQWTLQELSMTMAIGGIVNATATAITTPRFFHQPIEKIFKDFGVSVVIGAGSSVFGGRVANLVAKEAGPFLKAVVDGMAAGGGGAFAQEFVDFVFNGKEINGKVICGSVVNVVSASVGGAITGGVLCNLKIVKSQNVEFGFPSKSGLAPLPFHGLYGTRQVVDWYGATGVGGGSLFSSIVLSYFDELICGGWF